MQPEGGQSTRRGPAVVAAGALGVLAIVALAALLDVGPFGDDGTAASMTTAEFTDRGDEICQRAHDQFAELQRELPNSAEGAVALTQNLIEISENELNQIRALDAPPEVEEALERYLDAREDGIALLERGLQAAEERNAPAYADAQAEVAAGQLRRLKLAQAVGFSECSVVQTGSSGG